MGGIGEIFQNTDCYPHVECSDHAAGIKRIRVF